MALKTQNNKRYRNAAIIIFLILVVIFIASRFGHIIIGPRVIFDWTPAETLTEPALTLSGKVKGGRLMWINKVQVPVDTRGHFETQLVVPPGYSIIVIEAEDELGIRRRKELSVYYLPQPIISPVEPALDEVLSDFTNTQEETI